MLLCSETEDPISYASSWLSRDAAVPPEKFPETLDRWLRVLPELGIGKISFGAIILRRRSGVKNWVIHGPRARVPGKRALQRPAQRIFAAQGYPGLGRGHPGLASSS
ncbi:MAG: hypothetical protein MZV70_53620 [Desulfobacterales bacterium]|nr:hypothetical protein [Desulfobacterales bacterium]